MPIEWFPGHMATARKEAALAMRKTDVVLEVLDARVPFSSRNPIVESMRRKHQRPALKILNKADIADPALTQKWLAFYNAQPSVQALALSAKQGGAVKRIPERALALAPHRAKPAKPLRIMILGIPNVGKSTLMNALLKRNVTKVGDQPALTKSQLGHQLGPHMWLVDTPGLIPRELDQNAALKLAATHSIGPNAYDAVEVAGELACYLRDHYGEQFRGRFPLENPGPSGQEIIAAIARSRSLLVRGGEPDLERAARTLLGEFRDGTLGRISLESPDDVPEELPEIPGDEEPLEAGDED